MSLLSQYNQSQNTDFPNIRPSLDLRFALSKTLDPRISFTRGSTGTYVGPDGLIRTAPANQPRFDYDPLTGECRGLLIEESKTNAQLSSSAFNSSNWGFSFGINITTNATIAPDGTATATLITQDSSKSIHALGGGTAIGPYNYINFGLSVQYTLSIFVKQYNTNRITFLELLPSGTFTNGSYTKAGLVFDFTTQSFIKSIQWQDTTQSRLTGYSVTKLPNGWYRLSVTVLPSSTDSNNPRVILGIYPQDATLSSKNAMTTTTNIPSGAIGISGQNYNSITYAKAFVGDNSSGVYIWGAQVERGTFSTSYIPTSGSQVTRSADVATISGTNFSSFYNSDEGTIIASATPYTNSLNDVNNNPIGVACFNDGTNNNRIRFGSTDSGFLGTTWNTPASTVIQSRLSSGSISYNTRFKIGASYSTNNFRFCRDGGTTLTGLSGALPTVSQLNIGSSTTSSTGTFTGVINRLTYYPIQITNQQMINLCS